MKNKHNIRYLVLWVADYCNLQCKYCYAQKNFKRNKMSFATAKKAIELCDSKDFTLIFAGGEPLLNFELIEKTINFLDENHYRCKIGMQTNGTLITEEIAKKLKTANINIGVSFDGDIKTNEYLRGKTGCTLNGITLLKEEKININLNCVVTDKNITKLEDLINFAYYVGNVNGIGLDLLRINETSEKNDLLPPQPEDIYPNLKKAYKRTQLLEKLTGKKIGIREIEEMKIRANIKCSNGYCYSSFGQNMVVTPDGDTYPCSSLVGISEYFMGNIKDKVTPLTLEKGKYEKCSKCSYNDICKGCCPSRMIHNKEHFMEDRDCFLRKAVFRLLEEDK